MVVMHVNRAMKMTTTLSIGVAAALALLASGRANAGTLEPRTDINPAVLYWQGFSLYPEFAKEVKPGLLAEPPTLPLSEAEEPLKKLDRTFQFLRRAAQMKVRCDWGIDLSDGPETVIPNLVKIRQCYQAAQVRA